MFDGQSDVHLKNKLLEIGGIDLFKGTALEELAATRQCPSWLIEIPECLDLCVWSTVAGSSCDLLQSALKLGHHRHSSDDTHTRYRSIHASKFPCTCKNWFPGWGPPSHIVNVYDTPEPLPALDDVIGDISENLATRLNVPQHCIPTYVVANRYVHPTSFIGYHSHNDHLFGAPSGPTVMLSLNLLGDGMFVVRPKIEDEAIAAMFRFPSRHRDAAMSQHGYERPFLASENSLLVMGGYFQQVFMYRTISHNDIESNKDPALIPENNSMKNRAQAICDRYIQREKYCGPDTPRVASQCFEWKSIVNRLNTFRSWVEFLVQG